jgi:hypothetical protein
MGCGACDAEPASHPAPRDRVRRLCAQCWEDAFALHTDVHHPAPGSWLRDALHRVQRRQDRWASTFRIIEASHYRYRLEDDPPWLGFGNSEERTTVLCDAAVLGSWSKRGRTWLWGWANDWWTPELSRPFVRVKRAGERLGIERLWRSRFACDESDAWEVCAAAVDLVPGFEGIYRAPSDSGALFLAARRTRFLA